MQEEKRATKDEMVGRHHQLNGHEFEQTLGESEGQGSLVRCNLWGCKESDTTEQLNSNKDGLHYCTCFSLSLREGTGSVTIHFIEEKTFSSVGSSCSSA